MLNSISHEVIETFLPNAYGLQPRAYKCNFILHLYLISQSLLAF